ncbi:small-conductance mechanosensitive ion channel [Geotalea uraniireducens]|uniref:Small-conductance mechanosensitive ion channel n=1 Tax=Geotalea uraniireducens TaxID=351604 RepID=A0ABM8ELB1_9BACT|nr:mechanosensitive ion channel domain-containing protein [Geotalea uraniireducens]BDV43213.1 small-conductance mechanosensitive ion channel [Geotalea uraniireducens]
MANIINFLSLEASDNFLLFWLKEILIAVAIFALFWVSSLLIRLFLTKWAPRLTSFTSTDLDDRILQRITPPVCLLVVLAGLYYAVKSLPFPEKTHVAAAGTVFILNIIVLTNISWRVIDEVLSWYGNRLAERHGVGVDRQVIPPLEKLITIFLIGIALMITLKHFNYDILSVVTALGIGSLAIGMAAKDTLANMISGFTLMVDRPFRIGDRIKLASGQWGDVSDIGLRTTKIKTVDNTVLIIPNSELCNTTLINLAFPDPRGKGRVNVGVGYESNVEQVKNILIEVALAVPEVLPEPAPDAYFISFGDSALDMSLFFWVEDYTRIFAVTDMINEQIIKRFRQEGINIPYPMRTVLLEKEQ